MPITSFSPSQTYPRMSVQPIPNATVTTNNNASAQTYTAAQILGGLILRDPNGDARTDTLPTTALLLAAIQGAGVGASFQFVVRNTADGNEVITVAAGTGGTTSGTMTIGQNNSKRFMVVLTSSIGEPINGTADGYTVYSLGTVVH